MVEQPAPGDHSLVKVALLFLKLGTTAFGGPAAHIGMMRDEVVVRRKWLTDQQFLDLLGATNLIPGPNSTEMTIHIGFQQAGYRGLVIAGTCFILPAMLIVMALAWAYASFGSYPQITWLLYGIKPVIIAIVFHALWGLSKQAVKGVLTAAAGISVFVLYLFNVNEIALLFVTGLLVMILTNLRHPAQPPTDDSHSRPNGLAVLPFAAVSAAAQQVFNLPLLFFTFLKIGSILYGSGYVLLAFLHSDFVERLGWLTDQQLIDAIAVGQVTPGPVFTTATFIGYLLGGVPGALLATIGIFLPSFFFVALSHPFIPRLRKSRWAGALLDGVNVASLGLMAGVTLQLGQAALVNVLTGLIAIGSAVLLVRYRVNATWLIAGGALIGLISFLFF